MDQKDLWKRIFTDSGTFDTVYSIISDMMESKPQERYSPKEPILEYDNDGVHYEIFDK